MRIFILFFGLWVSQAANALAQLDFESDPVAYHRNKPTDRLAKLAERIEKGETHLRYSDEHGWLPSLLEHLEVSPLSQLLVFSKTSLQLRKISPRTPRALYFNDEAYVGWCQNGDLIEVAVTDPELGAVFYSVDQARSKQPRIRRDRGQCLSCHATQRTQGVPGFLVRSVFPDFNGRPRTGTRTYVTDHSTDFRQRFGGWYVAGKHGAIRHMGNVIARENLDPELLDRDVGANREALSGLCDLQPYLNESSDIVALMILEHQSQMHNLIARASMETRIARHYDAGINEALDRPATTISDSTRRRIDKAAEKLVRYLLFADEFPLSSPIESTSPFVDYFQSDANQARRVDSRGRSLRDLDLQVRMFKYPCSYLIYSDAFDALPAIMAEAVAERLRAILLADEPPEGYEYLSEETRRAIVEILDETKPGYLRDH